MNYSDFLQGSRSGSERQRATKIMEEIKKMNVNGIFLCWKGLDERRTDAVG